MSAPELEIPDPQVPDPQGPEPQVSQPPPADAFRLRGAPPPVVRLSRKGLAVGGGLAAAAIGAALTVALTPRPHRPPAEPPAQSSDNRQPAEAVTAAPKDYSQTPKLGPPLPGDLGRPILAAQARGALDAAQTPEPAPTAPAGRPASAANPSPSPAQVARQAALTSKVVADVGQTRASPAPSSAGWEPPPTTIGQAASPPASALAAPTSDQAAKRAFLQGQAPSATAQVTVLASPYTLLAGSVIPAAMVTGLNSDLPGQAIAQVTADVFDTVTGKLRLIPAGARLIGEYDSSVTFGQRRILVVWTRLVFPDGAGIALSRQPASDLQGFAGLADTVDNHWGAIAKAAALSTVLSVGTQAGADSDDDSLARALRRGVQETTNQAGQQIVRRQLDVQPTLTVRPGHPVRLILTQDLVLAPWSAGAQP